MNQINALTVTQVNQYIKRLFDVDPVLRQICVQGEIGTYSIRPGRGGGENHYFTLKDGESVLSCAMFLTRGSRLRFRPETGMKILAIGKVSVYLRDGKYQFYCEQMLPDGVGDLHVALEQRKEKLQKEGLFDQSKKRPLPVFPHRIAVVTSESGDAVHDILRILGARYPLSKVLILNVKVQGDRSPAEIAGAIRFVNRYALADVIISGRGGGSFEELFGYNDEALARTIYDSKIPVISAVGHEPDVTISDFVADLRAATPSNAAELLAPDQAELRQTLSGLLTRLNRQMTFRLEKERKRLELISSSYPLQNPMNYVLLRRQSLEQAKQRLAALAQALLSSKKRDAERLTARLDAMSPLKVLSRGYSLTFDKNGKLITDVKNISPGEPIRVRLENGSIRATVEQTEEAHGE